MIKFVTGMESSFKPEHSCGVPFLISGVFGSQIEDLLGQNTCFKNFGIKGETLGQIKILFNVGTYVKSSLSESEVLSFKIVVVFSVQLLKNLKQLSVASPSLCMWLWKFHENSMKLRFINAK